VVVRLDLFELEVDPVVLDQCLNNTSTGFTGSLLLLVERSRGSVLGILDGVLSLANSFIRVGGNGSAGGLSLALQVITDRSRRVSVDSFIQVGAGSRSALVDVSLGLASGILNSILGSAEVFVGVGGSGGSSLVDVALGLSCGVLCGILGSISVFVGVGGNGGSRGCNGERV
jgi:hypothetical protein